MLHPSSQGSHVCSHWPQAKAMERLDEPGEEVRSVVAADGGFYVQDFVGAGHATVIAGVALNGDFVGLRWERHAWIGLACFPLQGLHLVYYSG
uniref:Uncharacterized protein n=1 Tax=Arundo donax TaxID=35708 RepID=A0A0A9D8X3_ARUDO